MTKINAHKAIIPETILWRKDEDQAVIFNEETGEPYLLNETATRIWELCLEGKTIYRIIEILAEEFEGEQAMIEKETCSLLDTLQDKELLRLSIDGS